MSKKLKKYVPIVAAAFMLNLAGVVDVHAFERYFVPITGENLPIVASITHAKIEMTDTQKTFSEISGTFDPNTELFILVSFDNGKTWIKNKNDKTDYNTIYKGDVNATTSAEILVEVEKKDDGKWYLKDKYTINRVFDKDGTEITGNLIVKSITKLEKMYKTTNRDCILPPYQNKYNNPLFDEYITGNKNDGKVEINYPELPEITEICDSNHSIKGIGSKGSIVKIKRVNTQEVSGEIKIDNNGVWKYKFEKELTPGETIEVDGDFGDLQRYIITEDDLEKKDENKEDDKKEEGNSGENQGTDKEEGGNSGENQGTDKEEGGNSGENQDTDKEEGGNSGENQGIDKEQEGNNVENQDSDKKDEENKEQNQGNNNNQSNNSGSGGSHSSSSSGSHGGSSGSHSSSSSGSHSSSSSQNETNSNENDLDENVKKEVNVISENEINDNKLQIGWQFDGINNWSYIKEDKTKAVNCWLKIDGNWYNFDINGVMRKNYWLKDQEKWYYLKPSGAMATGWLKYNDKWYYLDGHGVMCTGWIQDNNNWYYLGQDGAMKTGWINVDNMWYYLDESGKMAVNTTINGYKINRHGIWVK